MKKILMSGIFIILFLNNLYCGDIIRQENGSNYEVDTSTYSRVAVSTTTFTTISYSNQYNAILTTITNESVNNVLFQKGGSTSAWVGEILFPNQKVVIDDYFGDIYLIADGAASNVTISQQERK